MNDDFSDLTGIEAQLAGMRPLRMDDELTSRLAGLLDGGVAQSAEDLAFERELRGLTPVQMPPQLFAACAALVDEAPVAAPAPNVVEFPAAKRNQRPLWVSAAAVAMLGAFTAMMLPNGKTTQVAQAKTPSVSPSPAITPRGDSIVPAGFNRGLQSAQDQGVVWQNGKGNRVVRVEYLDKAVIQQKDGKKVEVQTPRVEYLVVPENVD